MDRREFLKSGTLAVAMGGTPRDSSRSARADQERATSATAYDEPARQVKIVERADVVVCGAGPAGVAAAIMAARMGVKTRLLEVNGCLGGVWTAGLLSWILDFQNKHGLMPEIMARVKARTGPVLHGSESGYDVEQMKWLLDQMCHEAGVAVQVHTRVAAAACDENRRLRLAITESKSGRQAWSGKVFIDATGDGDLAAEAGCGFDYGRPGDGQAQPMSFIALLSGIDPEHVAPFVRTLAEPRKLGSPKENLLKEMRRAGCDPSYAAPTLFYIRPGLFCLMANHEYGVAGTDARQVTEATFRGRTEVHRLVDGLRKLGGGWKNVQIIATPEQIGVREGRRIHGLYQVTAEDLAGGRRHADAVCEARFSVDVHSTDPAKSKAIPGLGIKVKPYDIPYRALIAKDATALLLAGRCISGDFFAHASYRVTGNAVAMGEAAGASAAVAARTGRLPHEVPWTEIQEAIVARGQKVSSHASS